VKMRTRGDRCWRLGYGDGDGDHCPGALNPVRLNVSKVEKRSQTTYRSADGRYRHEQVNSTTSYTVQAR